MDDLNDDEMSTRKNTITNLLHKTFKVQSHAWLQLMNVIGVGHMISNNDVYIRDTISTAKRAWP